MNVITISLEPIFELTEEKFFQLCQKNRDLRFERSAQGDITIMAPEGSDTSMRSIEISADLVIWNRRKNLGVAFGSSGGFILPNGAMRSPDACWIL
jgi:Uma2 family endonuclease